MASYSKMSGYWDPKQNHRREEIGAQGWALRPQESFQGSRVKGALKTFDPLQKYWWVHNKTGRILERLASSV